ncbi:dehydrodolichyl diphosphate synthase complex subunit DHDDS [Rhipicephalus sanguineus]|uniref:dehydrodolichyl diphosphate synthase complex subunit DHDDS n=1 Tax=Rhipicephalus sanguineus TaxID=34632 RepID=UPI0020C4840F|nr:dehydrodolichyl diphosphate synthase complex subunit DHDDS [Rhipicephalus sanguineus]
MNVPAPTGTHGVRKDDSVIPSAEELLEYEGSPLWRDLVARCQRAAVWVVSLGAVPRHVCLVPDGHRRFSRDTSTDLRRVYAVGAHKYAKMREWWFRAGVEVLSVFMFSVRNFSRNTFDMTSALNQANQIHVDIVDNVDAFRAMGMQSCACGDLERLPEELRASLARAEIATSNIREKSLKRQVSCAAYNTTYQMSRMAQHLAKAVRGGYIHTEDLTAEFLDEYVALTECPSAELLLRSAGDQRFSDFEVLQCNYAYFHLGAKKWPAVGFPDWFRAMIEFQLMWPAIQAVKEKHVKMASYGSGRSDPEQVIRQRKFQRHVHAANILNMERLAGLHEGLICQ